MIVDIETFEAYWVHTFEFDGGSRATQRFVGNNTRDQSFEA